MKTWSLLKEEFCIRVRFLKPVSYDVLVIATLVNFSLNEAIVLQRKNCYSITMSVS